MVFLVHMVNPWFHETCNTQGTHRKKKASSPTMAFGMQLFCSFHDRRCVNVSFLSSEFCAVAQSRFVAPSRTRRTTYFFFFNSISQWSTKTTSPKTEARMPEILARGGVLQTCYIPYICENILILSRRYVQEIQHRCTSTELSWWHVIMLHV